MIRLPYFVLLCLLLFPTWLFAQSNEPIRVELEAVKDQDDYNFAQAGSDGAFVFYEGNSNIPDSSKWVFVHYDTNLVKDYHFLINLPTQIEFISHSKSNNYIYFFFQKRLPKKEPLQSFLVTVDLQTNQYNLQALPVLKNRDVSKIFAIDGQLVLVANGNRQDSIYFYHQEQNDMLSVGDIFPYRFEFCAPDTFNHRWLVGLTQARSEPGNDMFLYTYDYTSQKAGIQVFPVPNNAKGDHTYNSARAIAICKDTALIIGTYNTMKDRYSSNMHSGVYTLMLHGDVFDSARYFNYTNLKSLNSGNATPSKYSNLNLQLLIGNITTDGKEFAFSTEVIYPEYSYNYTGYDNFYGSPGSGTTTVFNGYRYINGYITSFDTTGNLLWDYYFPFSSIILMAAEPLLHVDFTPDGTVLYYTRNNRIISTLVDGYDIVEKMTTIPIETNYEHDAVDYNRNTKIEPWYGKHYIVTGYQYIMNRNRSGKGKRYVFFMNKLKYE